MISQFCSSSKHERKQFLITIKYNSHLLKNKNLSGHFMKIQIKSELTTFFANEVAFKEIFSLNLVLAG